MNSNFSPLSDVADVIDSLHKTPAYSDSGPPMVRVTDVKYGYLSVDNCLRVSEDTFEEFSRRYKPKPGDIVITRVGSYGNTALVNNTKFCLGQNTAAIIPKTINNRYLYAALNSPQVKAEIDSQVVGSTQKTLSLARIKALKIPRHPHQSEENIANLIGSLDDRITLLRETNKTLESIAQAFFKSWFVDFNPVRAKMEGRQPEGMDEATAELFPDSFEESELGLVPKGWSSTKLGEIAITRRNPIPVSKLNESVAYVGLEHIPRKELSLTGWGTAQGLESTKTEFVENDILFGKLRPYFHKVVLAPLNGVCSTDILVCKPKNSAFHAFIALHLFSDALVAYADRLSNGAKMPRVNWKDLADYQLVAPSESVATLFNLAIEPLFQRMRANVFQINTLADLRDTLLPRLISGQLRLPEAQEQFENTLT